MNLCPISYNLEKVLFGIGSYIMLVYNLIHSFFLLFIHSCFYSFIHLFIHSFIHLIQVCALPQTNVPKWKKIVFFGGFVLKSTQLGQKFVVFFTKNGIVKGHKNHIFLGKEKVKILKSAWHIPALSFVNIASA